MAIGAWSPNLKICQIWPRNLSSAHFMALVSVDQDLTANDPNTLASGRGEGAEKRAAFAMICKDGILLLGEWLNLTMLL